MKFVDEYRDKELIIRLAGLIREAAVKEYSFMEVCGGHTAAIHRFGIPSLLPENIRLLSGPGCPVCVTGTGFIDSVIALCRMDGIIISTFGDMVRIPGSESSLEKEKQMGADIRMVFSALEALETARMNPDKKVVFPGIGFETTAPGTAATIMEARKESIGNFYVLSAHKLMPPAMEIIAAGGAEINGFICPGHVAAITGPSCFGFLSEKHRIGCIITGFEPVDILQSVFMLVQQVNNRTPSTEIQYKRAVNQSGNNVAIKLINQVFEPADESWRGLGMIPLSGLKIRNEFRQYDAEQLLRVNVAGKEDNKLCICGEILRGLRNPSGCRLFANNCTPETPVGACMVSAEGSCNIYYKYRRNER